MLCLGRDPIEERREHLHLESLRVVRELERLLEARLDHVRREADALLLVGDHAPHELGTSPLDDGLQ